jgi:nucleosome binding factor SPN SPT16 subunit
VWESRVDSDRKHDTVILPIFGIPVPFHISMIKVARDAGFSTSVRCSFAELQSIGRGRIRVSPHQFHASRFANRQGQFSIPESTRDLSQRIVSDFTIRDIPQCLSI